MKAEIIETIATGIIGTPPANRKEFIRRSALMSAEGGALVSVSDTHPGGTRFIIDGHHVTREELAAAVAKIKASLEAAPVSTETTTEGPKTITIYASPAKNPNAGFMKMLDACPDTDIEPFEGSNPVFEIETEMQLDEVTTWVELIRNTQNKVTILDPALAEECNKAYVLYL